MRRVPREGPPADSVRCPACGQYTPAASDTCERCGEAPEASTRHHRRSRTVSFSAYGARPGLPWDDAGRGSALVRLGDTVATIVSRPRSAFAEMAPLGELGRAFAFPVLLIVPIAVVGWGAWLVALSGGGRSTASVLDGSLGPILGMALAQACVVPTFHAFFLHFMVALTGGGRYHFDATFRVTLYAWGAASPALALPIVGHLVAATWVMGFQAVGLREVQGLSSFRAGIVVLVPWLILTGCCVGTTGGRFRI